MNREALLRPALWVILGAWLGGLVYFGAGVAPALLRHAPSPLAGDLVRATLLVLDWWGVLAGLSLGLLAWFLRRGPLAIGLPVAMTVLCLLSQLWIAPAIAAARPGAPENHNESGVALRFRNLHRVSVSLYGGTALGAFALVVLHARRDAK